MNEDKIILVPAGKKVQKVEGDLSLSIPPGTIAGAAVKTADFDTGAGTDTVAMFGFALPGSGGAVIGGTATNPVRVDPTGTTTQPVSAASLPLPTGAATSAKQDSEISLLTDIENAVDGVEALLTTIDADTGTLAGAVIANKVQVNVITMPTVAVTQSGTWNITNISGTISLPTGAATSAKQDEQTAYLAETVGWLESINGMLVSGITVTASDFDIRDLDFHTDSVSIGGTVGVTGSDFDIRDLSSVTDFVSAVQSGTWNINDIGGTISLPTGAATSALQTTGNTSLSTIATRTTTLASAIYAAGGGPIANGIVIFGQNGGNPKAFALDASGNIIETNSGAIAASLSILDDWDETDRLKANIIAGQVGVDGGSGAASAATVRVALASNVSLPTGSNAIGKLAANSGVDIGDVDVLTLGGQTPTYGAGAVAAGTLRVTHASDDPLVTLFSNTISTANSTTAVLAGGAAFTGTSEDLKDYAMITITVFASHASATDGLSIQQSSNGTNWDIADTYTIPATTGKTYSIPRQGRFFRIVYTNGATLQTSFRLQTSFMRQGGKSSSQRPSDGYTNETDLEQFQSFGMLWNTATWDRAPGNAANGADVDITRAPAITKGSQDTRGFTTQDLKDAGRTPIVLSATNAAAGTTTTETAITLTKAAGTGATSAAVSFVITNGKTFRITEIVFASKGNAVATAQETTFKLRINAAGAVTTASTPIILQARTATAAVANAYDRYIVPIPDGLEFTGDGTIQFGVTAAAVYVANAPTWDVTIIGFEY